MGFITRLLFIILSNYILCTSTNIYDYPSSLIDIEHFPNFSIISVPYCKKHFCKVLYADNKSLQITSKKNFNLDKYFRIKNLNTFIIRDDFNGMTVIIPKILYSGYNEIDSKNSDRESNSKSSNLVNRTISSQNKENAKNSDTMSGYYNLGKNWIPY